MSGICAVWHRDRRHDTARRLAAAVGGLSVASVERPRHETDGGVGIGVQARFADSQQMFRNDRVLLACDAELVNEQELRNEVGPPGSEHPGPGALLAALYGSHGDAFVERLRGGFSVVLWDLVERRLIAAVDHFGVKRLAWYDDGQMLLIASRVNAVRAGTGALEINPRAVANVVNFSANLAPETIFTRVHRLGPGMVLRASERETRTARYWDMRYGTGERASEAQLSRELEAVVERSVAEHCARPDLQLGAFLSGGTDSSTVVGMMTRALGAPVKAFSIGYEEQPFNELEYARLAARAFGSEHHTYLVSARDCHDALPDIVRCFDEPFGNASAVATYFCARLAAEHGATTLLAGDGGDELFGGNERYATEHLFEIYHRVPQWLRTGLIEPLVASGVGAPLMRRARGYIRRANMPGVERMFSFAFLRAHAPEEVFNGDFLRALGGYGVLDIPTRHYADAPASDHLDHLLYVDLKVTLADNDLPKVTCVSELAGVRARFPFLDRQVAEFSGRIPARLKVKGFEKRYLFKRAFRRLLPAEILRKKKHGFGIPVAWWMKSDPQIRALARDALLSPRALVGDYFRREFVEDLFRRHDATTATYYGDILWTFLMLELWHKQVLDHPARVVA